MFTTPFQLGLKYSLGSKSEKIKENLWVMDKKTLEYKGIKILNYKIMFFTPTKQNYSKHVEKINVWKKMKK
jgi:hypothetical protein